MSKQYTIREICDITGYSRRTIRYYVQIGLIEPPSGRGRGGFYNDSHVNKLKQVKALQEKGMQLSVIMEYLKTERAGVPEEDVAKREIWVRIEIAPGIEISVRRDIEEKKGKKIDEIIRVAKSILKEDLPGGSNE